ncbi:hypothetical protein [Enterococcus sp. DIV1420a]|uniref:hypothetical protein n=1 Tax=Enterococcus sp. DIV1420a TaxID=2774672 RepID=UPI003F1EE35C
MKRLDILGEMMAWVETNNCHSFDEFLMHAEKQLSWQSVLKENSYKSAICSFILFIKKNRNLM